MKSIILTEKEIDTINSFINEVTLIPLVECIYVVPYIDNKTNKETCDIVTIYNESLYYNGKITGSETVRETKPEKELLKNTIEKYKNILTEEKFSLSIDDSWNYSICLMHRREVISETALISGTILFDRFDNKTENQNDSKNYLKPYPNIIEIENIDNIKYTKKQEIPSKKVLKP